MDYICAECPFSWFIFCVCSVGIYQIEIKYKYMSPFSSLTLYICFLYDVLYIGAFIS